MFIDITRIIELDRVTCDAGPSSCCSTGRSASTGRPRRRERGDPRGPDGRASLPGRAGPRSGCQARVEARVIVPRVADAPGSMRNVRSALIFRLVLVPDAVEEQASGSRGDCDDAGCPCCIYAEDGRVDLSEPSRPGAAGFLNQPLETGLFQSDCLGLCPTCGVEPKPNKVRLPRRDVVDLRDSHPLADLKKRTERRIPDSPRSGKFQNHGQSEATSFQGPARQAPRARCPSARSVSRTCPNCHEKKLPHRVCPHCGFSTRGGKWCRRPEI